MGYAVVHMQKVKMGGVRGMQSHINRERPSRTNPDIDPSRTEENYGLLYQERFQRAIKERIDLFAPKTRTIRKDAVVYCSFVITSDEQTMKAMSPERQREFFEESYAWFAQRYGSEVIINASVHMDETTPHMHLGIVPITGDRLSAKALFDKKELISLQTDFAAEVGVKFGLERGREGSDRTHLSELRYKLETAKEKIEKQAQESAQKAVEADKMNREYKSLAEKKNALESEIEGLTAKKEILTSVQVEAIKGEKSFLGGLKGVSFKEYAALKRTAVGVDQMALERDHALQRAVQAEEKAKKAYADANRQLAEKKREIEQDRPSLKMHMENIALRRENEELKEKIKRQRGMIDRLLAVLKEHVPAVFEMIQANLKGKRKEKDRDDDVR